MTFIQGSTNNLTIDDADLTLLNGNVHARGLTIAGIQVSVTHGLQTVSNVSNSTSNTIQFTSDTTGFVTTANAEIGKDLLVSGNVHVSSNASIAVDSNVVAEYTGPHGRGVATLKKFPEIIFEDGKFDANDTTNTYTQAGYTVTANATHENRAHEPWVIFNGNFTANDEWQISTNLGGDRYSETDGTYNSGVDLAGSTIADQTYNGDWVQVSLPQKIKLSHMNLGTGVDYGDSRMPEEGVLLGSNDGTTWSNVLAFGQTSYQHSVFTKIDVNSSDYYSYYRMIWLKITAGNDSTHRNRASLALWELYGYEEDPPTGDTSIDTTFTSVMNTPQTGGVKVYVDGPTLENKVVGPTPVGTSATYNSTDKYWELTGTLVSNISVEANTFLEGDAPHSVSVWFNSSNLEANASKSCVFSVSDQEKLDSQNLDLQSNTWHNLTYAYQGEGGSRVTYLDGRKVSEDQAEDTFGEYPPFEMTGYSQGGYVVSASSDNFSTTGFYAWKAFNDVQGDEGWHGGTGNGNTTHFAANAGGSEYDPNLVPVGYSTSLGGNTGEWIKLEMPHKLVVDYVTLKARGTSTASTQSPKDFKILGSNDDINWDILESFTSVPYSITGENHMVGATKGYKYIAMLVTRIQVTTLSDCVVGEIEYYGHRENDLVRLPDPTNVLKYPHIAMTGPAQRGYVATASAEYFDGNYPAWKAFNEDNSGSTTGWLSQNVTNLYNPTYNTGVASSRLHSIDTPPGEYVILTLPHKLLMTKISIVARNTGTSEVPRSFKIYGSNTGTSWDEVLDVVDNTNINTSTYTTIDADTSTIAYNQFAIVITKTVSTTAYVGIGDLELYGTGVDSIPIQIGGGNIDKVANFRVYDKFIGEDQALEIWDAQKDEFGRTKSSVTLHKGRLGIGTTEPEGRLAVLDEPNGLEEFPPRAMTAEETYMEGHGVFKASASSVIATNYEGWRVFDEYTNSNATNDPSGRWTAANNTSTIGSLTGKWVKLELPYRVNFSKIGIFPPSYSGGSAQCPTGFSIIASNDDETWTTIKTLSNYTWTEFAYNYITFENDGYFKYITVVATTNGGNPNTSFQELKYFGTREQGQSVLHDGQLTLTKNLNVPRIGPPLDADDTPRRDRLVVEYNTSTNPTFEGAVRDTSGRGVDGIMHTATYNASEKAIESNGNTGTFNDGPGGSASGSTNDYGSFETVLPSSLRGNPVFTVSGWFKQNTIAHLQLPWLVARNVRVTANPGLSNKMHWLGITSTGRPRLALGGGGNLNLYYTDGSIKAGIWHHMVVVIEPTGTDVTQNHVRFYLDGVLQTTSDSGSSGTIDLGDGAPPRMHWFWQEAADVYYNGSASSLKIHDCALTASEVKTLYDMGRNGSVANPQPLHISGPVNFVGNIRYTSIAPNPARSARHLFLNGITQDGVYPICGVNGTTSYPIYCKMDPQYYGGNWMCFAQIPRSTNEPFVGFNLFSDAYGNSGDLLATNLFSVPISILSNNAYGTDIDVLVELDGRGMRRTVGNKLGGIWRGIYLNQALDTSYVGTVSTSSHQYSEDGIYWVNGSAVTFTKVNASWKLAISTSTGTHSWDSFSETAGGWLIHRQTGVNDFALAYGVVMRGNDAISFTGATDWAVARIFVRPTQT